MTSPARRSASSSRLRPATRSDTVHGINSAPPALAPAEASPVSQPEPAPPIQAAVPQSKAQKDRAAAGEGWAGFEMPASVHKKPKAAPLDRLLQGAATPVTLYLPQAVAEGLRAVQGALRVPGGPQVAQSSLLGYALAYGYANYAAWIGSVPADSRRRGSRAEPLTSDGAKKTATVTLPAQQLGDEILWYLQGLDEASAPSRLTLMATAVAWALSCHQVWADDYLARAR